MAGIELGKELNTFLVVGSDFLEAAANPLNMLAEVLAGDLVAVVSNKYLERFPKQDAIPALLLGGKKLRAVSDGCHGYLGIKIVGYLFSP